jgi:hypothetical protein
MLFGFQRSAARREGAISLVRVKDGVERGYFPRFGGELVLVKRAPFGEKGFFAPTNPTGK